MPYKSTELEVNKLLTMVLQRNASDLHLIAGKPPTLRIDSELVELKEYEVLSGNAIAAMVAVLLETPERNQQLMTERELNLPPQLKELINHKQGLILFVGPTGHGKSTSQASLIDLVNHTRAENIVTIEDPIEYVYIPDKSLINQREVGSDTQAFGRALKSVLREDANVILVGEMRDLESIATTITVAETGHLVFATVHTNDAAQTIDRIIDVFPSHQQNQIRAQLSNILVAVISQRLLPKIGGGRVPAVEIMLNSNAVANVIRENKTYELPNIIHTSQSHGMISLDYSLAKLVRTNTCRLEDVIMFVSDHDLFQGLLKH